MARPEHNMQFWRFGHPPRERKEETGVGAGKHLKTPQSHSVTLPVQRGAERSQEYPSEVPPHVKEPPSLGNKTLSTNPRVQVLIVSVHKPHGGVANQVLLSLLPL